MTKTQERELTQKINDTMSHVLQIRTVVLGVNGDNGINGRQKDMERDVEALRDAYHDIKADVGTMRQDMSDMKKSAKFWTRTIGSALIIQIIAVLFSLLTK